METHILFFLAAILAGAINSLAGGGGLITFPLLTLVIPPVAADATSALGLVLAYPTAVWRTRREIFELSRRLVGVLLVPSVIGGLAGALLLVYTNERNLAFLVPWLILVGTVLFVLGPRLAHGHSGSPSSRNVPAKLLPLVSVVVLAVAIYGGYFGAGIGILMISVLSLFGVGDIGRVVPLKNLLTGSLRGVAVVVLIIEGAVNWGTASRWSSVASWVDTSVARSRVGWTLASCAGWSSSSVSASPPTTSGTSTVPLYSV